MKPDRKGIPLSIPFRKSKNGVVVEVRVQPRASRKGIEGVEGDVLKVKLTAPPAEGEANAQLLEVLSDALGVPKSRMRIVKGQASRNKVVEIEGVEGA